MDRFGLVGEKLSHSFSKIIHEKLSNYNYDIIEVPKNNFDDFIEEKNFGAVNITIPYKKDIIKHLYKISNEAKEINAVNTVVNYNNKLYGFNTDYYGLKCLLEKNNFNLKNKNVLILGSGGTSNTAYVLCKNLEAKEVVKVSRADGKNNINKDDSNCKIVTYEDLKGDFLNYDFIINTTPVGMFPNVDVSPIEVNKFKKLEGVIDVIYNPLTTKLVNDAKNLEIKSCNGLYMLIMQAVVASYYFNLLFDKNSEEKLDKAINSNNDINSEIDIYIKNKMNEICEIEKELFQSYNSV